MKRLLMAISAASVMVSGCGSSNSDFNNMINTMQNEPLVQMQSVSKNSFNKLKAQINISESTNAQFIASSGSLLLKKKIQIFFTLTHALPFGKGKMPEIKSINSIMVNGKYIKKEDLKELADSIIEANDKNEIYPVEIIQGSNHRGGNRLAGNLAKMVENYQGHTSN